MADQVYALAANISVGIGVGARAAASLVIGDVVETEALVEGGLYRTTFSVMAADSAGAEITTFPVEIYTVQIGSDTRTEDAFEDIAGTTGGSTFVAADASEVVDTLLSIVSTQVEFDGTDAGEEIRGNINDNIIDAMGGDDTVEPLAGADSISLGDGADVLIGAVSDFYNDTVSDFGEEDRLIFEDILLGRDQITVTTGSAILGIDADDDGATDGSLTLEGDFSGGDFMAVADGTDTTITFETFLPTLSEKTAVDAALVNGVNNQAFLTGDGTHDFRITLDASARSGYHNTVGVYEIDAAGNIINVRILIADTHDDPSATVDITGVAAGNELGFFIVQNGAGFADGLDPTDTLSFINSSGGATAANIADGADLMLAVNGTSAGVTVFHSYDMSLNTDGVGHTLTGVDAGGESLTMGFEDLTGGGDRDYQDVVFSVERFIEPETVDRSAETTAQSIATGDGDDTVVGGSAGDTISTGDGDDVITGGAGDDQLIGGDDADQFIFGLGDGNDVIEDFSVGLDMLILNDGLTIASTSEAALGGGADLDTLVTLSSGQTITLWDVNGLTNTDDLLTA